MIIFFGATELIFILILFFVILAGSAKAIMSMINFLIVFFIIKNIIQTIVLGYFKNKNSLLYTIAFSSIDTVRMLIFFSNLRSIGTDFLDATGLKYFSALFGFILYFLICGSIFITGEFISLTQSLGNNSEDQGFSNIHALLGGIGTVFLLAIVTWAGYL